MRVLRLLFAAVMVAALGFAMQPAEAYQEQEIDRCTGCGKWRVIHDIETKRVQDLFTDKVSVTTDFEVHIRLASEPDLGNMKPPPTGGILLEFECGGIVREGTTLIVRRKNTGIYWAVNSTRASWERFRRFHATATTDPEVTMILRFGNSPPLHANASGSWAGKKLGWIPLGWRLGFKEKLLEVQRLVGQVQVPRFPTAQITGVWDVRGLDAAFKYAIALFEAESARESVNLRNPCGW